jgi:phosphoglycerate dehydrogenase-like enzyme
MNILIHRALPESVVQDFVSEFAHHIVEVLHPSETIDPHLPWAEAIVGNPSPRGILDHADKLQWLQLLSSGFDGYEAFADAAFQVTTSHGIHAPVIAEQCLTSMLMLERRMPLFSQSQSERSWDRQARIQGSLRGKTLGILGYGSIAQALSELVQAFGMKVIAMTKNPANKAPSGTTKIVGTDYLDTLLQAAEHLILTLPLTKETQNILSAEKIALLKEDCFVHNVGRGGLLDQAALESRLAEGSIGGAALDVFAVEPLPKDSALWKLPNCIVTPHIAGHYQDLDIDLLHLFAENLRRLDNGQTLKNLANFQRGY